jgi:parallel beta-helix repeat protein
LGNTADGVNLEFNGTAPTTVEASKIWNNVISGNNGDGVEVAAQNVSFSGFNSNAPQVAALFVVDMAARRRSNFNANSPEIAPTGNRIGTNAAGTAALGNSGNGVSITNVTTNIGGANPADGNIIAHNGAKGIVIFSGTGNLIESNAIFSNAILNIDLGGDGLTPNDLGDTDTGANNLQNYPVLTSASSSGAGTTVSGAINTTPNTALTLQFFASTGGAMITGGNPLGTFAVTSNASGNASFSATFPVGTPAGRFVSATARTNDTNVGNENNTSEISPGVAVLGPTAASVSVAGRVLYANGRGVARAIVSLTNTSGATRTAMTNSFGYYRFEDVAAGETYVFNVTAKRLSFAPLALNLTEEIESLNFTAQFSQKRLR